jgi:hypothetical protein
MRAVLVCLLCLLLLASLLFHVAHAYGHGVPAPGSADHSCAIADPGDGTDSATPEQGGAKLPTATCPSMLDCGAATVESAPGLSEPPRGGQPTVQLEKFRAVHPISPPGHPPRPSADA